MEIKNLLRKLWRKTLEYAVLICPIVLLWLVMCWLKEVVPFGNGLIDYGDMKEQSEPMYLFCGMFYMVERIYFLIGQLA